MRYLIVNNYQPPAKGKLVMQQVLKMLKSMAEGSPEFVDLRNEYTVIESFEELEEFVCSPSSNSTTAAHRFDLLDGVMILGDYTRLPWMDCNKLILGLVRNCLIVDKPLFVCSGAAYTLLYLAATLSDGDIQVLNKGCLQKTWQDTISQIQPKTESSMLLQPRTGDLYAFDQQSSSWVPRLNIGLHYRPLMERDPLLQNIVTRPAFRISEVDKGFDMFKQSNFDTYCTLRREKVAHPLFEGVETSFVISCPSPWVPHPFIPLSDSRRLSILADAEQSVSICECGKTIALLFQPDIRHPNDIRIIKNYCLMMLQWSRNNDKPRLVETYLKGKEMGGEEKMKADRGGENSIVRVQVERKEKFASRDPFVSEEEKESIKRESKKFKEHIQTIYRNIIRSNQEQARKAYEEKSKNLITQILTKGIFAGNLLDDGRSKSVNEPRPRRLKTFRSDLSIERMYNDKYFPPAAPPQPKEPSEQVNRLIYKIKPLPFEAINTKVNSGLVTRRLKLPESSIRILTLEPSKADNRELSFLPRTKLRRTAEEERSIRSKHPSFRL